MLMTKMFEQQLADIITEFDELSARSTMADLSDVLTRTEVVNLRTRCMAAIVRASGPSSTYSVSAAESRKRKANDYYSLRREVGIASALLSDIRNGYLISFEELLHGDVFGDYLEMASHLLKSGYKDAAAVLAGGTLEVHIRKMCDKHNINTSLGGKPRKTDGLKFRVSQGWSVLKVRSKERNRLAGAEE